MRLSGIKQKSSTSYHPETDGASERTNKTVIQCLRYHVERNQRGWVKALPKVRFDMMNNINVSTGLSGFELKSGHSPCIVPPLPVEPASEERTMDGEALDVLTKIQVNMFEAQDNLLGAKISQAHHANKHRGPEKEYLPGDKVMLSTAHRRRNYMQAQDGHVAKFMPRWDGPYEVLEAFPGSSDYKLRLPESSLRCPIFHSSQLRPHIENDDKLFPGRSRDPPRPIVTTNGQEEYFIKKIIDERSRGRGKQYLV
jgi:hypothetical protein